MKRLTFTFRFTLILATMFIALSASGQNLNVTGVVYDKANNEPLIGVTVLTASGEGTITDVDGVFNMSVAKGELLTFSFIGYKAQPINIISNEPLEIFLESDIELLGEVIAIGYGVQKKEDKTGAVYSVNDEDLQTVAIQDPIESIQGKVPGVTIRKSGSDPNAGFDVKIRGASGLSSSTNPLYVVDGVVGVDPTTIAAEDIASLNVLKDASSAAIYGSRGANGVIIITTKRGESGKPKIELGSYVSIDNVSKRSLLDLMTADEYRAYGESSGIAIRDLGYDTDWQDEIYRTGISHNEIVSFSGGNESGNYRASLSNNSQEGVVENSSKSRTIMRINAMTKALNDKLTLSMNLANTIEHNNYVNYGSSGADGVLYQAFQRNPTAPVYNEDGSYWQDDTPPVNNYSNPVAVLNDIQNERDAKRLLANVKAEAQLMKGLKLTLNGAYTRDDDETFYFEPSTNSALNGNGNGSRNYSNNASYLFEAYANYSKNFSEIHHLNLTGGYSYQRFEWDGFNAYGENPASDYTESNDLGSMALVVPGNIGSYKGESLLISGFGRAAYNYNSRYFVTATVRRDGSSKFGENHEWGIFPSASLAWNIKNESFLENVEAFSQMKLRLGWGQTGNQEIDSYKNIALFGRKGYTKDPDTGVYTVNYGATQNPNPNLKWEVNTELNVGLDLGFLNNRLTVSAEYYNKKTSDLIYSYTVSVPPNLVDNTLANAGAIDINGVEAAITGHIYDNERFKWSSTLVLSHNKAIVSALGNEDFPPVERVNEGYLQEPLGYGTSTQIMMEGEQRGTFYGPKFAGINQHGDFVYYMADGTLRTIDYVQEEDKQILGYAQPKLELGWSNTMTVFKHIDVNFTFRGMFGHDILNATNMVFDNPSYFPTRNVLASAPDRADILTGSSDFSDYFLEKGNFLRLENITIGYNFDTSNVWWLGKARAYVSGNNLMTLTNYTGIDPSTIGIDIFNVYPKSTSFTCGVNFTF